MRCPKKDKHCIPGGYIKGKKNNYICCGINACPEKYSLDTIGLCLKGELYSTALEMTKEEALFIISVLSLRLTAEEK